MLMIRDHHSKYGNNEVVWNIVGIIQLWQRHQRQMLLERWCQIDLLQCRVATNLHNLKKKKKPPPHYLWSIMISCSKMRYACTQQGLHTRRIVWKIQNSSRPQQGKKHTFGMSSSQQKLIKNTQRNRKICPIHRKKEFDRNTTEEPQTLRQNTEHFHVEIEQYTLKQSIGQRRNHRK